LGTIVLVFFMARILMLTRSPVAIWYSASMGVTLAASLYEALSAAMGIKGFIGSVNFVTAALSSSLLAALAIAVQLRQKHQQWLEAQAELQHTYEAMPIGLFTLNPDGKFLSSNPALSSMLDVGEIKPGQDSWAGHFKDDAWSQLHHMVQTQSEGELEIQPQGEAGAEPKRFLVRATLARGRIEGSLQDITARAKATEDLHFMANNDPLTKVLNRRGIDSALENALLRLSGHTQLSLAYLDLDRFKLINDLYGHPAGDEVLKQVCERINGMLSGSQKIGRVGGDEFVIILPDTPIALASWVCRGIVDCIGMSPYYIGDKAFQVRGSIGLIEVGPGTKIKDAVSTADRACRAAKSGNDGLVVYEKNAAAFHERESELRLIEQLSAGEAPAGLFLDMQPIMSLKNPHASLNFEVLLRMRDSDGSVISAGRLIPAAESSGRIGLLDRWVLSTTLAWLNTNYAKLDRTQFVCMNLSGASLNDERFVQDAFEILEKNRHVANLLCLEITESVALHDLANTRRFIDQVRSYGVKTALDDFGAGYTSFTYLKDLPSDVLKIDGNFIVNMNAHPANVAIVEAIVSLAMNLGMKTIAEWAEDNATVQTLVEIGVDYVQGYVVARPQTPEMILAAASSASFIKDRELEKYVRGLTMVSEEPPDFPPGVTLISSGGMLVTK
jgi:diguanylate cyclase (GGDEF)-like protein